MKNLKKHVVISLIMSIILLVALVSNVNASSGGLLISTGDTTPSPSPSASPSASPSPSPSGTISGTPTPTPTPRPNTTVKPTNNINNDVSKDLPQTGENDIYIVSAIGMVALVIGGVAYMKSRKYEM